jgi:hypothetical protein
MQSNAREQIRKQVVYVAAATSDCGPLVEPDFHASERIVESVDDDWIYDLLDYIREESAARVGTEWPDFKSAFQEHDIDWSAKWRSNNDFAMLELWSAWMEHHLERAAEMLPGILREAACRRLLISSIGDLPDYDRARSLRSLIDIAHDLSNEDISDLFRALSPRKSEAAKEFARELRAVFQGPADAEKIAMLEYFLTDRDFTVKYSDSPLLLTYLRALPQTNTGV